MTGFSTSSQALFDFDPEFFFCSLFGNTKQLVYLED
jgi:hypothetical protein